MGRDCDVHDASAIVGQHHQDEQEAARHGRHHEEVGRRELFPVIRQEGAPCLGRSGTVAGNGGPCIWRRSPDRCRSRVSARSETRTDIIGKQRIHDRRQRQLCRGEGSFHQGHALGETALQHIITVSDTGEGISPLFLPSVFDRFRQANSGITRVHGGLGLGLAIVRQLTEAHGGTVHADSPRILSGATFTIRLRIRAGASLPLPRARAKDMTCQDLHDLRAPVVDDDPDARELLSVMLEQCMATVSLASSAAEGLALLQTGRHDLLIADIGMPGQDGYDLIRAVRGQSPARGGRVPAIAVTAYAGDKDQKEPLAAGYDAHLPKPVDADRLYRVIANLLSRTAASGKRRQPALPKESRYRKDHPKGGLTVPGIAPILGNQQLAVIQDRLQPSAWR